jgi:hypothetical protein
MPFMNKAREILDTDYSVTKEEPSYMMFARANVRDGFQTPPSVVKALLERIDRLESTRNA